MTFLMDCYDWVLNFNFFLGSLILIFEGYFFDLETESEGNQLEEPAFFAG